MTRLSEDALLVALGKQRERAYVAQENAGSPLFSPIAEIHAYREALGRCDAPLEMLAAAQRELCERLNVGWQRATDNPQFDGQWITLLVRYEAVCDALDVPAARTRLTRAEVTAY